METNLIKVKPYESSSLSESLKSLCQKTTPQCVFKNNRSKCAWVHYYLEIFMCKPGKI